MEPRLAYLDELSQNTVWCSQTVHLDMLSVRAPRSDWASDHFHHLIGLRHCYRSATEAATGVAGGGSPEAWGSGAGGWHEEGVTLALHSAWAMECLGYPTAGVYFV